MGKTLSLSYENQHLWARNEALNLLLFPNKTLEINIWNPSLILAQKPATSNSFKHSVLELDPFLLSNLLGTNFGK
jgi:hypothetical protein